MRNTSYSKLIYFLALFSPGELDLFKDYLDSPVFNKKEEPRKLFAYIRKQCLKKPVREIDDEKAAAMIWPGEDTDSGKLQKAKSLLMNLVLDFLPFQNWNEKSSAKEIALLEELNRLGDESYFIQYYKKAKDKIYGEANLKLETYMSRLDLEANYMAFQQRNETRKADNHLAETNAQLKNLLVSYMLKFSYITANQSQIVGASRLPDWFQVSIDKITAADVEGEPLPEIYYLLNKTLDEHCVPEDLSLLKKLILKHAHHFAPDEAYDVFTGAINNYSRVIKRGDQEQLEELFELYQSLVEVYGRKMGKGLLPWHFKNAVSIGSRLGRFEWVDHLLTEGKNMLPADGAERENAIDYNAGVFLFYKKEYKQAEKKLNRVMGEVKDVFYGYDVRAYLLMCFYETGDSLGLETLIHSFRMFLNRSEKVPDARKENYHAFIRVFRMLLATPPNDQIRLQHLKAEIDLLKFSGMKSWLIEKWDRIQSGAY